MMVVSRPSNRILAVVLEGYLAIHLAQKHAEIAAQIRVVLCE